MQNKITQHGQEIALAAFNTGNFQLLETLWRDACAHDSGRQRSGVLSTFAAIEYLSGILQNARAAGYGTAAAAYTPAEINYIATATPKRFAAAALEVITASKELKRKAPGMRVSTTVQKKAEPDPPAAPPQPIEVRVISMPSRQTTTTVNTDAAGDIVSTHQVESDL